VDESTDTLREHCVREITMADEVKPYEISSTIDSMDLKASGDFYQAKFDEAKKFYEDHNVGGELKMTTEEVKNFQLRQEELKKAKERFTGLREADDSFKAARDSYQKMVSTPVNDLPYGGGRVGEGEYKSLGQMVIESDRYKTHEKGSGWKQVEMEIDNISLKSMDEAEVKATMTGSSGFPIFSPRMPLIVPLAQRRPVVADLIPSSETTWPSIIWVEETTFTNAAATVAEGGPKPESALVYTQRNTPVQKIATVIPATDEQIEDYPQLRSLIDDRLTLMLKLTEEVQLLTGTGVSPQLLGFLPKPGVGSIARAAGEDNPDPILRAMTDVNAITGFANASGIVIHPLNMLAIRLLRSTTGDYIWGHPSVTGPLTLWGLPVVQTPAITLGTALTGDFQMYSHISRKLGIRIALGYINTDFTDDITRVRAEERLSLEIYRASAFCLATNLNVAP
jgi:HK97 family phage major capsid protein